MAASLALALKSLFAVLGCLVTATVIYTVATDGLPFRKQLLTPPGLSKGIQLDYINTLGGVASVFRKFLKLSTQLSLQDPIYFVLLQRQKKTETEQKRKCSLLTARILSLTLGCLMLGTLIYTIVTDGSPFHRDVLTP